MDIHYHTIKIEGNLTVIDSAARQQLRDAIELRDPFIILDLTDVGYIDSAGLELIAKLHRRVEKQNGLVKIIGANPGVQEVLDICGMARLMKLQII